MKLYLLTLITVPCLLSAQTPETVQPITRVQAEAMVQADMAQKEAQREVKRIDFTVLQRRTYNLGDSTFTVERAAPPNLPEREAKPEPAPPTTAEQQAFQEMVQQIQQTKLISLRAVVYDNYGTPITHLRWQYEGETYEAWSEADFNLFRTLHDFAPEGEGYRLSMFIFNESVEAMDQRRKAARAEGIELNMPIIPTLPASQEGVTEYFVESDNPDVFKNEAAFTPLDHAHAFYDSHLDELKTKLANQEEVNAARKRYLEQNPPSKDTTLTYWIEEK